MARFTTITTALMLISACGQPTRATSADIDADLASLPNATTSAPVAPIALPSASLSNEQATSQDTSNVGVNQILAPVLVAAGRLGNQTITAVQQSSRCATTFTTRNSSANIDWTLVSDFQARLDDAFVVIPINAGGSTHVFSVPADKRPEPVGNARARVEGAFGTLVDGCSKG